MTLLCVDGVVSVAFFFVPELFWFPEFVSSVLLVLVEPEAYSTSLSETFVVTFWPDLHTIQVMTAVMHSNIGEQRETSTIYVCVCACTRAPRTTKALGFSVFFFH